MTPLRVCAQYAQGDKQQETQAVRNSVLPHRQRLPALGELKHVVWWAARGPAACGGESFPSAHREPSAVTPAAQEHAETFPAKVLNTSLFAKRLRYLLWFREMFLLKAENKWGCFPPLTLPVCRSRHLWSVVPYKQKKELLWSLLIRETPHHHTSHRFLLLFLCLQ